MKKINTPYLTIHNDEDGAVPWEQGIEFISALRRLGKEGYMFNYNGERHGLRNRDNQKHWTVHMDEFFDHYLLGKPRPEWMDKGVPFLERGKRDVAHPGALGGEPQLASGSEVQRVWVGDRNVEARDLPAGGVDTADVSVAVPRVPQRVVGSDEFRRAGMEAQAASVV